MKSILHEEANDDILKAIFNLFCNEATKRISLNLFKMLIEKGDNINSLYLKLKYKFGASNIYLI